MVNRSIHITRRAYSKQEAFYAINRLVANRPLNDKYICAVESWDFLNSMNSFFDLDEFAAIKRSCGHYIFNLSSWRRLWQSSSRPEAKMKIWEGMRKKLKLVENQNARFSVSNHIVVWSQTNHMPGTVCSQIENHFVFKCRKWHRIQKTNKQE